MQNFHTFLILIANCQDPSFQRNNSQKRACMRLFRHFMILKLDIKLAKQDQNQIMILDDGSYL